LNILSEIGIRDQLYVEDDLDSDESECPLEEPDRGDQGFDQLDTCQGKEHLSTKMNMVHGLTTH